MSNSNISQLSVSIPCRVSVPGEGQVPREVFYAWLWDQFGQHGLVGIHEGTLLCERALWIFDSAEAPSDRDWIDDQIQVQAELYFSNLSQSKNAEGVLRQIVDLKVGLPQEEIPQDWDAQWKASFLNQGEGVVIPPFWRIIPPWVKTVESGEQREKAIRINPGAGFGTGTHETTQLCLELLGDFFLKQEMQDKRCLDFGSGSGILGIALALLGSRVDAIELDQLALDNAQENAKLNQCQDKIQFYKALPPQGLTPEYSLIVANILRPVLLDFSEALVSRLIPGGGLILSGLLENDIPLILGHYQKLLVFEQSAIFAKGEWRAVLIKNAL